MKKVLLTTLAAATILTGNFMFAPPKAEASNVDDAKSLVASVAAKFKDVKGHWAEEAIAKAYDLKLITGYQDGTFKPNGKITRAEFGAILSRATKLTTTTGTNLFPDMQGNWAEPAISQLVAQGFINPSDYPKGFNPNAEMTRYEMMKWIANGLIKSDDSFKKAFEDTKNTLLPTPEATRNEISSDQVPNIALVRGTGIIEGFEDGSLKPSSTTTRAEVAAILLRYMNVEGSNADSYTDLKEMREVGTTGSNLTTLTNYFYSVRSVKVNDIANSKITLKNNAGILNLHRLIVVDARGSKPKGIYAPLFVGKSYLQGGYLVFSDVSFTSNLETSKSDPIVYNSGLPGTLISFHRIDLKVANKNGLVTIPMNTSELFTKGVEKRLWMQSVLETRNWGYNLHTDTAGTILIQNH
ncbi:S-layer homology domain-containing protein [Paenibacillus sp.]|jgi:hypothetical protein|uniref:S-layer homology domain-containing protein n=1 Tax=Paenibacillus sp. TaxID=58172 RepID=UPI00282508C6|nr:S-layer homology domain-containing protein [Paenibacillus sp.]MDR0270860.1 S-layer homology domain-containing protein [Paenibacillus sp.]